MFRSFVFLLLVVMFTLMLLLAAQGGRSFEEVWSTGLVTAAHSWTDFFLNPVLRDEGRLNSFILFFIGEKGSPTSIRFPSIAAGLLCLMCMGMFAFERWGEKHAFWSVVFFTLSYPALVVFSEAQGSALTMCLAALGALVLQRALREFAWIRVPLFWSVCGLGIFSDLGFAIPLAGFTAWILAFRIETNAPLRIRAAQAALLILPTLGGAVAWWWIVPKMLPSTLTVTAASRSGIELLEDFSTLLSGLPEREGMLAMALMTIVVASGIFLLYRRGEGIFVFFLVVFLFAPAAVALLHRGAWTILSPVFPFFPILLSFLWLETSHVKGRGIHIGVAALLVLAISGHVTKSFDLITNSRGSYRDVLARLHEVSPDGIVFIGGDPENAQRLLIQTFGREVYEEKTPRFAHVTSARWADSTPEWIVQETNRRDGATAKSLKFDFASYEPFGVFPERGMAGRVWQVYVRAE